MKARKTWGVEKMKKKMNKGLLVGFSLLLTAGLTAACGSNNNNGNSASSATDTPATTNSAEATNAAEATKLHLKIQ